MMTRPLATFLFAKDFYTAWQYVPLLLVCSVLNGAAGFIGPILSARKDSKTLAKSAVWSSISNILLNLLLTYYFGVQGAVIATVISSYFMYIYRKRVIGDKIESNLYKTIMFVWVLLIAQSFVEIYWQNYYIQLAVFAFILFIMNKPIIKCLSKAKNYLIKKANKIQNDIL